MMDSDGEPIVFKSLSLVFSDKNINLDNDERKQYALLLAPGIPLVGIMTVTEDDENKKEQTTTAEYYKIDNLVSIKGELLE